MSLALSTVPATAASHALDAGEALADRVTASKNPVLIIVVAAAIVLGLGLIAFLTASCISHGYRGFSAIVNVSWNNPLNATVKFNCFA